MKNILLTAVAVLSATVAVAQLKTPDASPRSVVTQQVGLTDIEVVYSRPSVKGRTVFGDLVPYGKLWRTGANAATVIEFSTDVEFGGTKVKGGKYALYTVPNANEWKVLLYDETQIWGDPGKNYDPAKVVAEMTVKPQTLSPRVETFTIGFDDLKNNDANLVLAWDNVIVKAPIKVNTREAVVKSINNTMSGPTASDYFRAATYYHEEKIDADKALEWATKAVELNPKAYWMLKLKSDTQAAKKDYKNAVKTAEKALDAAQKAGNEAYAKMVQNNINDWKKK
ncbi:MAG: DUF2911 domain-containing protein [Capnocytophaga sp.]|nr:DUF2911 domain-containing protein [Capnocytophaga sp.]